MSRIAVTCFSDPGCPWAYSASPALAVLRWRFGDQLDWTLRTIGLRDTPSSAYPPERQAAGYVSFRNRFGMPFATAPRPRSVATGPACRVIVAARLNGGGDEWAVYRALQFGWFTAPRVMDEREELIDALAAAGIDGAALVDAALTDPAVEAAYQEDRAAARTAAGSPTEAMGRAANSDGAVRYTAPSLLFSDANGRALDAGGFLPLEAYDLVLANLDPALHRRPAPDDVAELLAAFPGGLTTAEVAACLAERLDAPDRLDAERRLVAAGARRQPLGSDALWFAA